MPPRLRPSGYASWIYERAYGSAGPLYDWVVRGGFLLMGGERACRRRFAGWCGAEPGDRVASLCCGTGGTERALVARTPRVRVTALDLGRGQIRRARRKDRSGRIDYLIANASRAPLRSQAFDRVLIGLALHEMPRDLRRAVLREACRLCRPGGRVVVIDHARPPGAASRFFRDLLWFFWLPGNPEAATSRDMQRRGLEREMEDAGLRVVERHGIRPRWVEGLVARPR